MYEANGFRRNDNRKGTFASAVLAGRAGRPTFAQEKTLHRTEWSNEKATKRDSG